MTISTSKIVAILSLGLTVVLIGIFAFKVVDHKKSKATARVNRKDSANERLDKNGKANGPFDFRKNTISKLGFPYSLSRTVDSVTCDSPCGLIKVNKTYGQTWRFQSTKHNTSISSNGWVESSDPEAEYLGNNTTRCHKTISVKILQAESGKIFPAYGGCTPPNQDQNPATKYVLPSKDIGEALMMGRLLELGLAPIDSLKEGALKSHQDILLEFFLFGTNDPVILPMEYSLRLEGVVLNIKGNFRLKRVPNPNAWERPDASVISVDGDVPLVRVWASNFSKYCTAPVTDRNTIRWCQTIQGFLKQPELDMAVHSWPWREPENFSNFNNALDQDGADMYMRFFDEVCVRSIAVEGPNVSDEEYQAARNRHFQKYFASSPDLNRRDKFGRSAIFYSVFFGCEEETLKMLSLGAKANDHDYYGIPLLAYATNGLAKPSLVDIISKSAKEGDLVAGDFAFRFNSDWWQSQTHHAEYRALPIPGREAILSALDDKKDFIFDSLLIGGRSIPFEFKTKMAKALIDRGNISKLRAAEKHGIRIDEMSENGRVVYPAYNWYEMHYNFSPEFKAELDRAKAHGRLKILEDCKKSQQHSNCEELIKK